MAENKFESSMKELETIVSKLEKGDLSLDDMLAEFERGISISRACSKLLDDAEKKVNILIQKPDGMEKQEFAPLSD